MEEKIFKQPLIIKLKNGEVEIFSSNYGLIISKIEKDRIKGFFRRLFSKIFRFKLWIKCDTNHKAILLDSMHCVVIMFDKKGEEFSTIWENLKPKLKEYPSTILKGGFRSNNFIIGRSSS